jgi:hypothetical protein
MQLVVSRIVEMLAGDDEKVLESAAPASIEGARTLNRTIIRGVIRAP